MSAKQTTACILAVGNKLSSFDHMHKFRGSQAETLNTLHEAKSIPVMARGVLTENVSLRGNPSICESLPVFNEPSTALQTQTLINLGRSACSKIAGSLSRTYLLGLPIV
jgi:hypothetical protein